MMPPLNSNSTLDSAAVEDLRTRLRGSVLLPGDVGYEESRTVWNAMIDRRPALIARCTGVADVIAAVDFARDNGITLTIKGGGHNISGLAVADGAMMLDMSPMKGVMVDPDERIGRAHAGCLLGDVDRETQIHGLAAVLGFVSNTGIAGLTLGGGFGYLTRQFGWTCDNVRAIELVTAEGRLVRASEDENADLFWGLRGGGGNFGVATRFDYELYPVGPVIVGGAVAWSGDAAPEVLELYRRMAAEAPRELALVAVLRLAPPAPWLPQEIHGKLIAAIFACYTGPVKHGDELVAPIKAYGKPVGDVLQRRSYLSQQSILDATQPKGRRYYWKSEYLSSLEDGLLEKCLEYARQLRSPHSGVVLFPLGGALNEAAHDVSPMGNRDAEYVLNITASWDSSDDDEENVTWARDAWTDMRRYSTGGTYINFLTEEEVGDRIHDAYGGHFERLAQVKSTWDPGNFFRVNKNISPGPTR
ncbi:MAG: FAD-binding oxidoreductase [Gemmatimonadota bacterium]|nr:MAG: FAD-binding oxidoreductase [Gemmatimonadota bacterium]